MRPLGPTMALLLGCPDRLELVNPTIRHQREEEMSVLGHVRPNETPLLHHLVVQGAGRALGARQRQWTKLKLIRTARLPGAAPSIAVDARVQLPTGGELNGVLR